jgi:hypothetical protein
LLLFPPWLLLFAAKPVMMVDSNMAAAIARHLTLCPPIIGN